MEAFVVGAILTLMAGMGYALIRERKYHAYGFLCPYDPETRGYYRIPDDEVHLADESKVRGGINLALSSGQEMGFRVVLTNQRLYVAYSTAAANQWLLVRPVRQICRLKCDDPLIHGNEGFVRIEFDPGSAISFISLKTKNLTMWAEANKAIETTRKVA